MQFLTARFSTEDLFVDLDMEFAEVKYATSPDNSNNAFVRDNLSLEFSGGSNEEDTQL